MATQISTKLEEFNPWRRWMATVYDNISGDNKHQYICYDCFGYLHTNNRNTVVTGIHESKTGDYAVVTDGYIRT